MSSFSAALLRSVPSSVIAGNLIGPASPYLPGDILTCAPHGVEHIEVLPSNGVPVNPGATCMFEFPLEVDLVTKATLRFRLEKIVQTLIPPAVAIVDEAKAHYTNGIGFACIEELWLQFGTEKLQTIRSGDEFFCKMQTQFMEEDKENIKAMAGFNTVGGLVKAALKPQTIYVPLLTLLHLSFGGDVSQPIPTRMLGEKVKLYIKFRPANQWISCGSLTTASVTVNGVAITSSTQQANLMDANSLFQGGMYFEGQHIFEDERQAHEALACQPRRILISEQQQVRNVRVPAATATTGAVTIDLREFTQPVASVYVMIRWAEDLDRKIGQNGKVSGVAVGSGFDPWNIGGWYDQCAANKDIALPLVKSLRIDCGGSLVALKEVDVDTLRLYEHARKFKGKSSDGGGLLHFTYSHDPCRPSAVLGYLDFSQTDMPRLRLQLQVPEALITTVGLASVRDTCDSASDLDVTVIAFTHNVLHAHQNALFHPFN